MKQEEDRARDQAKMQLESISEMVSALQDNENDEEIEAARQTIQEDALEVATGKEFNGTKTYMVLLCTGGPAVRIIGELDEHDQPDSARLQYQDWGTPWTDYNLTADEEKTLIAYANEFYYGE